MSQVRATTEQNTQSIQDLEVKLQAIRSYLDSPDNPTREKYMKECNGLFMTFFNKTEDNKSTALPKSTERSKDEFNALKDYVAACQAFIYDLPLDTQSQIDENREVHRIICSLTTICAMIIGASIDDNNYTINSPSDSSTIQLPLPSPQLLSITFDEIKSVLNAKNLSDRAKLHKYKVFINEFGKSYPANTDFNKLVMEFEIPGVSEEENKAKSDALEFLVNALNNLIEVCYSSYNEKSDEEFRIAKKEFFMRGSSFDINDINISNKIFPIESAADNTFTIKKQQAALQLLLSAFNEKLTDINTLDSKLQLDFNSACEEKIVAFKNVVNNPTSSQYDKDKAFKALNGACSNFLNTLEGDKANTVKARYVAAGVVAAAAFLVGAVFVGAAAVSLLSGGTLAIPSFAAAAALSTKTIALASAMSAGAGLATGGLTFGLFRQLRKPDTTEIDLGITKVGEIVTAAENVVKVTR